jgi:hypothetical protein
MVLFYVTGCSAAGIVPCVALFGFSIIINFKMENQAAKIAFKLSNNSSRSKNQIYVTGCTYDKCRVILSIKKPGRGLCASGTPSGRALPHFRNHSYC